MTSEMANGVWRPSRAYYLSNFYLPIQTSATSPSLQEICFLSLGYLFNSYPSSDQLKIFVLNVFSSPVVTSKVKHLRGFYLFIFFIRVPQETFVLDFISRNNPFKHAPSSWQNKYLGSHYHKDYFLYLRNHSCLGILKTPEKLRPTVTKVMLLRDFSSVPKTLEFWIWCRAAVPRWWSSLVFSPDCS